MKILNVFLIISAMLLVFTINAEETAEKEKKFFDLEGKTVVATRVLNLPGTDTTKGEVHYTVRLALDVNGKFKIIAVGRSGDGYTDQWDTFAGQDIDYDPSFNVRSLYLEKEGTINGFIEKYKVQLGSIPTDDGLLRSGGFWGAGWIDGGRVKAENSFGTIQVTGGSMDALDDPSVFDRDLDFNYVEVKVSKRLFEVLMVEAAYENYEDVSYFKAGANYDWHFDSNRMVKLILEYISSSEGGFKSVVGIESKFFQLLTGKKSDIKFRVSWQYVSDDFDLSARPATSFWVKDDNTLLFELSGPVCKKWNLSWYAQLRVNFDEEWNYDKNDTYFIGGLKWTFDWF